MRTEQHEEIANSIVNDGRRQAATLAATLRVATSLIFATIGEVITERAGILNLGIEGIMFLGAFSGFAVAATLFEAGVPGVAVNLFNATNNQFIGTEIHFAE